MQHVCVFYEHSLFLIGLLFDQKNYKLMIVLLTQTQQHQPAKRIYHFSHQYWWGFFSEHKIKMRIAKKVTLYYVLIINDFNFLGIFGTCYVK